MSGPRKLYPFVHTPELEGERRHVPVVIVGAGPIGMAAARDLAIRGIASIVLDDDNKVSVGSRAICWSKRTLEIFDRLGCAAPMLAKGVTWNRGKVFFGDDRAPVFSFDLLPAGNECFPAFINLQQYYAEEFLVDTLERTPLATLRWQSRVTGVQDRGDRVEVNVETPDGPYRLTCDYLIAADGSRSAVRSMLGLDFEGQVFQDHFLIADIRMQADFPSERWFWFDPPFARGQSALLHRQPDDIWRIDFQLGWDVDRERELEPERVRARIRRMLGESTEFELEWTSIYTFQCRRLERFVHGRIIFAGDSAHLVSPFGARGANGGIQDVDNLCWKLALILDGAAPPTLLESYDVERVHAARENILNSTRSTDFITPKSAVSRTFRNAVLELARDHPAIRSFVNSGRLSVPCVLDDSPLTADDCEPFGGRFGPGVVITDAPVLTAGRRSWLLRELGNDFTLLRFAPATRHDSEGLDLPIRTRVLDIVAPEATATGPGILVDVAGKCAADSAAPPGACLLVRPDRHVAGCWTRYDPERIRAAAFKCIGLRSST